MTPNEIAAFNSGVLTVLKLASSTAETMESLMVLKPTRFNFAAEALRGLAEEGRALLKRPDGSSSADAQVTVPTPSLSGGTAIVIAAE